MPSTIARMELLMAPLRVCIASTIPTLSRNAATADTLNSSSDSPESNQDHVAVVPEDFPFVHLARLTWPSAAPAHRAGAADGRGRRSQACR